MGRLANVSVCDISFSEIIKNARKEGKTILSEGKTAAAAKKNKQVLLKPFIVSFRVLGIL